MDLKAIFSSFYPNKSANTEKDFTSSTTYFLIFLLNLAVTYTAGETTVSLQETLDGMMPSMLPLALTLLCFWLIDKKKVGPVPLMFIVMIVGVIGSMAGILA